MSGDKEGVDTTITAQMYVHGCWSWSLTGEPYRVWRLIEPYLARGFRVKWDVTVIRQLGLLALSDAA